MSLKNSWKNNYLRKTSSSEDKIGHQSQYLPRTELALISHIGHWHAVHSIRFLAAPNFLQNLYHILQFFFFYTMGLAIEIIV